MRIIPKNSMDLEKLRRELEAQGMIENGINFLLNGMQEDIDLVLRRRKAYELNEDNFCQL